MNDNSKCPPQRATSSLSKKVYVEFELELGMLSDIRALAREARCMPFELCVKLVQEQLATRGSRRRRGASRAVAPR